MSLKILVIQTSFLGDVILATSIVEKLHSFYPDSAIDFLVRKGNEVILQNNPKIHKVLVWDKKAKKYNSLFGIVKSVRKAGYDYVINLHRYSSSGLITFLSGAKFKVGFHNNPFSFCYTHKFQHSIGNGLHEVERNHQLIAFLTDAQFAYPKLYPSDSDFESTLSLKREKYIGIAPGSVWATKRLPVEKWVELCNNSQYVIYILGAPSESTLAEEIISSSVNKRIQNLCSNLSLLETASLIEDAMMNYVNDSAPLHICSAMNAPCTAFFCSTLPEFGFGPLSSESKVIQTSLNLDCKPCGIHGRNACPLGHFKCGHTIDLLNIEII